MSSREVAALTLLGLAPGTLLRHEQSHCHGAPPHSDKEGQAIAYERSQLSAVTTQALEHLAEVGAALERVATGRYGICQVCGEPIDEARMEARPPRGRACTMVPPPADRPR